MHTDGARISPTAHYTSQVWVENGLSHPSLSTTRGQRYYRALRPFDRAWERISGEAGLESSLLARHRTIDELLAKEIEAGAVSQVIEIAAGYSPRALRFTARYPSLRYVEGDLAPVALRKRAQLDRAGLRGPRHEVRTLDALLDDGPDSLFAAAATLDSTSGVAIVAEGLLGYLDRPTVSVLSRRIAGTLRRFSRGVFLSDAYVARDFRRPGVRAFRVFLGAFVRGRTYSQADDVASAEALFRGAGFARATLRVLPRAPAVHILEAHVD